MLLSGCVACLVLCLHFSVVAAQRRPPYHWKDSKRAVPAQSKTDTSPPAAPPQLPPQVVQPDGSASTANTPSQLATPIPLVSATSSPTTDSPPFAVPPTTTVVPPGPLVAHAEARRAVHPGYGQSSPGPRLEDMCIFECPEGGVAAARENVPIPDVGCEAYPHVITKRGGKFTDCCISHQKCYRTCNQTKVFCDDQFKRCLQRMCLAMWDQIGCRNKAAALHTVARSHCYEYTQAQGVACVCEHDGRVPSVATQDKGNDEL